ncbi:hypothetical protein ACUXMI_005294 [Cupriavidus metallidurans]|jgi:hypothetical protein
MREYSNPIHDDTTSVLCINLASWCIFDAAGGTG